MTAPNRTYVLRTVEDFYALDPEQRIIAANEFYHLCMALSAVEDMGLTMSLKDPKAFHWTEDKELAAVIREATQS